MDGNLVWGEQASLDLAVACSLQDQYDREAADGLQSNPSFTQPRDNSIVQRTHSCRVVDKKLELADPNPNIHQLFMEYDSLFFWGKLSSSGVAVAWSDRMTL